MCDASGETSRHVAPSGLETLARLGEGRVASASALWTRSRNAPRCQAAPPSCPVGGGISQVLAGIARSPGRLFRKTEPAIGKKENEVKGKSTCVPHASLILLSWPSARRPAEERRRSCLASFTGATNK